MKLLVILHLFLATLLAEEIFGVVSKVKGEAYAITENKKTLQLKTNSIVHINSTIYTKEKSRVIIKFGKNIIALNQNSKLYIDNKSVVTQEDGTIFYKINPLKNILNNINKLSENRFKLKTKTATIGIRGTNFIVNIDNGQKVFLRQGKLNIASINEEFKMYVKKELDDFTTFKQETNDDFSEFRTSQEEEFTTFKQEVQNDFSRFIKIQEHEFSQNKKEFMLEDNRYIYIKDTKVYQEKFSKEIDNIFNEFDEFILK